MGNYDYFCCFNCRECKTTDYDLVKCACGEIYFFNEHNCGCSGCKMSDKSVCKGCLMSDKVLKKNKVLCGKDLIFSCDHCIKNFGDMREATRWEYMHKYDKEYDELQVAFSNHLEKIKNNVFDDDYKIIGDYDYMYDAVN